MELSAAGGGLRLRLSSADTGELLVYDVDANGNLTLADIDALPTNGVAAEELSAITVGGEELLVAVVPLSASVSQLVAFNPVTGQTYDFADAGNRVTSIAVVSVGGSEFVYVAYADGSPIDCFEREAGGDFALAGAVSPGVDVGIAGLQVVEVAGRTLLIVSDYSGNIHSFGVSPDGSLTLIDSEGAGEGLGISGPAEAECVTLGGVTYVIQAATGSSSLSVLRIESDGSLTPTDHVIDSQNTRFQSVTAMDAVTVNGHVYLIVGGADGGISLLKLLPGGTLYHLGKIVDTTTTTLSAINSIEAAVVGGTIQVFVSSGDSAGFTQITLTPGPVGTTKVGTGGADTVTGTSGDDVLAGGDGADVISGGSGDDFLLDGAGVDTLTGGSGADVFVLTYDQGVDVIMDFDRTKDRLDLSAFPLLRNVDQLQITPMPWGARISYLGEVIEIRTVDGTPLTAAQIASLGVVNLDHYMRLEALMGVDLDGTDGQDFLEGTQMRDTLRGHLGNDVLRGHGGGDFLDGGAGTDLADYSQLDIGVAVDLANPSENSGGALGDTLVGIEGVLGTESADVLRGDKGSNVLIGNGGHDTLVGNAGDDRLEGRGGNDVLLGGAGPDILLGGSGNDSISGGTSTDQLFGGSGADTLDGGEETDVMFVDRFDIVTDTGTVGYDKAQINDPAGVALSLAGWSGVERVNGYVGNDVIDAATYGKAILLYGDDGADTLIGSEFNDVLLGGDGDDSLLGGGGKDVLLGGRGSDAFDGGDGSDIFYIGESGDTVNDSGASGYDRAIINNPAGIALNVSGWTGVERIVGYVGNDTITAAGGTEALTITGGDGDDQLTGGEAGDTFYAGNGADTVAGGGGADALMGGSGADRLDGGAGDDFLLGGADADTFVFTEGFGRDVIKDFTDGVDLIDFSGHAGVTSLSDLEIVTDGGKTVIRLAGGGDDEVITIVGVAPEDIDAGDFIFA